MCKTTWRLYLASIVLPDCQTPSARVWKLVHRMNTFSFRIAATTTGKNILCLLICVALLGSASIAQESPAIDSDHDGLSDALEQALLIQFQPVFMVARHDCSILPAEFQAHISLPHTVADNGTIYGQVFPAGISTSASPVV